MPSRTFVSSHLLAIAITRLRHVQNATKRSTSTVASYVVPPRELTDVRTSTSLHVNSYVDVAVHRIPASDIFVDWILGGSADTSSEDWLRCISQSEEAKVQARSLLAVYAAYISGRRVLQIKLKTRFDSFLRFFGYDENGNINGITGSKSEEAQDSDDGGRRSGVSPPCDPPRSPLICAIPAHCFVLST